MYWTCNPIRPTPASYALQTLGDGVFRVLKEDFYEHRGKRSGQYTQDIENEVYTIWSLLTKSYHKSEVVSNIISRLESSILCVPLSRGSKRTIIRGQQLCFAHIEQINNRICLLCVVLILLF